MSKELCYLATAGVGTELIAPQVVAASVTQGNGPIVGPILTKGDIMVVLHCDLASQGTNPTLDVSIYESADGSTGWTLVPGSAFTRVTGAAGGGVQIKALNAAPRLGYLTAKLVLGGTATPHFAASAAVICLPPP